MKLKSRSEDCIWNHLEFVQELGEPMDEHRFARWVRLSCNAYWHVGISH